MASVYCYDPTISDEKSKVRGVGRYLHILRENFENEWIFTDNIKQIFTDSIFVNPFFNFLQKPLTLQRLAKKQIAVIHDLIPLKYPEHFPVGIKGKLNIFLNKLALKNYNTVVTDSEASKKDIVSMLNVEENRVKVIYPCLPKTFSNSVLSSGLIVHGKKTTDYELPTMNYCLYVGDATWNKNLVNLAKAIKEINVTCVFVGKIFGSSRNSEIQNSGNLIHPENPSLRQSEFIHPWQKELKEFMELTIDDKRFIFAGFIPDEKLIQLYQKAKCNILVSRDEGFGFSYLEAASQGCPSVLSDIPVFKEISASKGAIFANPENPNEIANAIGKIYLNKEIRYTLGAESKRRAKNFENSSFKNDFKKISNFKFRF